MPTDLDRTIHDALADLVAVAPTLDDVALVDRTVTGTAAAPDRSRGGWGLAVAAAAVIAVGAGALLALRPDTPPPHTMATAPPAPVQGATVGEYYLPTNLPDGFVLLGFEEHGAAPDTPPSPAQALYVDDDTGARVMLRGEPLDGSWTSAERTTELPDGVAYWFEWPTDSDVPVHLFQIVRFDMVIGGEVRGLPEDELTALFQAITAPDTESIPTLDDPRFTLATSASQGAIRVVAEATAYFGRPGSGNAWFGTTVRVQRFADPIDQALLSGVWTETTSRSGRTIHLGTMGIAAWWSPSPDLLVSANSEALPVTATDVVANLEETGADAVDAAIRAIPTTQPAESNSVLGASLGSVTTVMSIGSGADLEGVCLDVDGKQRCDRTMRVRGSFINEDQLVESSADLLVDGHWYTVGFTPDAAAQSTATDVEFFTHDDQQWYLVRHPDDAATNESGLPGLPTRPGR